MFEWGKRLQERLHGMHSAVFVQPVADPLSKLGDEAEVPL